MVKTADLKPNENGVRGRGLPLSKPHSSSVGLGKLVFHPPKVNQKVYGMHLDLLTSWESGTIIDISEQADEPIYSVQFTYENILKNLFGTQIAFMKPVQGIFLPVGSRIIARFNDVLGDNPATHRKFFAGIVAEQPGPANKTRYLIFFDDGFSQYVLPEHVLPVVGSPKEDSVSEIVHYEMRPFIQKYLAHYPERNLLEANVGDLLNVELYGVWLPVRVEEVDSSLMKIGYLKYKGRYEWIFRGCTRLEPLFRPKDPVRKDLQQVKTPVVPNGLKRKDVSKLEQPRGKKNALVPVVKYKIAGLVNYETAGSMTKIVIPSDSPTPRRLVGHNCSSSCAFKYEEASFRKVSPLVIPFYLGWARELSSPTSNIVAYISPCGFRLNSYELIQAYIRKTRSDIPIDFFSLEANMDCLNQFHPARELQSLKDISYGNEWTPVQCANSIDRELPPTLEYSSTRTFGKSSKKINQDDFLVCCDCTDDCKNKEKCACWQLTLSGMSFEASGKDKVRGYENRRLPEPVSSGIYECNKRCKCNVRTCSNRVAQNKVKWPVQIFKTILKGWGVRALHDIPKGSFLCVYAGRILSWDEADDEGCMFGDEYIADLDYIEGREIMKEGYESHCVGISDEEEGGTQTNKPLKDDTKNKGKMANGDGNVRPQIARKSTSGGAKLKDGKTASTAPNSSSHAVSTKSTSNKQVKPLSYRKYFGMDGKYERPYTIDGKRFGNFGRYFNHSCDPNLFIQNIFVDTHDLRFPWVAFFTNKDVKAGTELCWDYGYVVGSVPTKTLYCFCDSSNCRKKLL